MRLVILNNKTFTFEQCTRLATNEELTAEIGNLNKVVSNLECALENTIAAFNTAQQENTQLKKEIAELEASKYTFTKGDIASITGNTNEHGFNLGEIVEVVAFWNYKGNVEMYWCKNSKDKKRLVKARELQAI